MKWFRGLLLLNMLLWCAPAFAAVGEYNYPYANPLLATILGVPADQKAPSAEDLKVRLLDLEIFPERQVPDVFWYNKRLRCSLAYQKQKAPLIFVIAGTGAGFNSDKMLTLQSTLYRSGFHVVSLSSPTHANFVTAASSSSVPGILKDDSSDLYRVMQMVWEKIKSDIEVSDFHLTGYSLGGAQAAYVSMLDEERKIFNFRKVLMINPPVNLYTSADLLDHLLEDNVLGGAENTGVFLRQLMDLFSETYKTGDFVKFDHEFLYNIYRGLPAPPKDENLAAMIGLTFRISAINMMFTSDVMSRSGFVVPKTMELDHNDYLDDYFRTLLRVSFIKYLDEMMLPVAQRRDPQLDRQELIDNASLKSIDSYLRQAEKVGVLTNEDDIILAAGELDYLKRLFGTRAMVFPRGGHCGNLDHHDVADYLATYFNRP